MKNETDRRFASRNEAKKWLFYYIEVIYNRHRILLLIGVLCKNMNIFTGGNEMNTLGNRVPTNLGVVYACGCAL